MAKKDETNKDEQPRNTQKLVEGFISELVKVEDALERDSEPHIEARKDILSAAKDNQLNVKALQRAVKFRRASEKKRQAMIKEEQDTETYLSFVQLTLFPGEAS